jgi:hypothetical protein
MGAAASAERGEREDETARQKDSNREPETLHDLLRRPSRNRLSALSENQMAAPAAVRFRNVRRNIVATNMP